MKNNNKDLRLMFVIAAVFAASMLAISVVIETLDLFGDAEAKRKAKKRKADFILPEVPIVVPVSLPSPSILNQLV
jgi:hypothetical protein